MKLLIVDDAKLMRGMIKNAFKSVPDVTILEAENGEEAIQLFGATKPDLVTMDITMDFKNGVDASRGSQDHHGHSSGTGKPAQGMHRPGSQGFHRETVHQGPPSFRGLKGTERQTGGGLKGS